VPRSTLRAARNGDGVLTGNGVLTGEGAGER
jgi:hypothetical protein